MAGRAWSSMQYGSAVFVFITYVYMCYGCTVDNGTDVLERAHFSEVMATGKVTELLRGSYMYDTMYTAEVEIMCSFKGGPLPKTILIKEAGTNPDSSHEPGLCISNLFEVGVKYLLFLKRNSAGDFVPSFNEDLLDPQIVDDLALYCGVEVMYPEGVTADTAMEECPIPEYEYEDECIKYEETTQPDQPELRTMKPEGNGDQNDGDMGKDKGTQAVGKPEPEDNSPTDAGSVAQVEGGAGTGARMFSSLALLLVCLSLAVL